jgi:hypothetical protein
MLERLTCESVAGQRTAEILFVAGLHELAVFDALVDKQGLSNAAATAAIRAAKVAWRAS